MIVDAKRNRPRKVTKSSPAHKKRFRQKEKQTCWISNLKVANLSVATAEESNL
jgi:hypothetical protein